MLSRISLATVAAMFAFQLPAAQAQTLAPWSPVASTAAPVFPGAVTTAIAGDEHGRIWVVNAREATAVAASDLSPISGSDWNSPAGRTIGSECAIACTRDGSVVAVWASRDQNGPFVTYVVIADHGVPCAVDGVASGEMLTAWQSQLYYAQAYGPHIAPTRDGGFAISYQYIDEMSDSQTLVQLFDSGFQPVTAQIVVKATLSPTAYSNWDEYAPLCQTPNGRIATQFNWFNAAVAPLASIPATHAWAIAADLRGLVVCITTAGECQPWLQNGHQLPGGQLIPCGAFYSFANVALSDKLGGVATWIEDVGTPSAPAPGAAWAQTINPRGKLVGQPFAVPAQGTVTGLWVSHDGFEMALCGPTGDITKYTR